MSIRQEDLIAALRELLSQPVKITAEEVAAREYPKGYAHRTGWTADGFTHWREPIPMRAMQIQADYETRKLEKLRKQLREALQL
jgi:hypothetical protein